MRSYTIFRVMLALAACAQAGAAASASYDCAKAATAVEKVICEDPALSKLDEELAAVYQEIKGKDTSVVAQQRTWLSMKRDACKDRECLANEYLTRIRNLRDAGSPPVPSTSSTRPSTPVAGESPKLSAPSESGPSEPSGLRTSPVSVDAGAIASQEVARVSVSRNDEGSKGNFLDFWWLLIPLAAAAIYAVKGFSSRCPKCGKWRADKVIAEICVEERSGFRTVTRQDQHKDNDGNVVKTVERQEQVRIVSQTIRRDHRCKFCAHEWSNDSIRESENSI